MYKNDRMGVGVQKSYTRMDPKFYSLYYSLLMKYRTCAVNSIQDPTSLNILIFKLLEWC